MEGARRRRACAGARRRGGGNRHPLRGRPMAAVAQASPRHVSDVSPPPSAREDQRPQRGCRRVAAADQHHRHARLNRGRQEGGAVSRKHVGQPVKEEVARRRVGGRSGGGGGGRGGPGGGRCAQLSLAERRRAAPAEKVAAAVRARRVDDSGEALDQRLFACVTWTCQASQDVSWTCRLRSASLRRGRRVAPRRRWRLAPRSRPP